MHCEKEILNRNLIILYIYLYSCTLLYHLKKWYLVQWLTLGTTDADPEGSNPVGGILLFYTI